MTFQKLLNEYLGGASRLQSGYWQRYKHKAWRLFGVRVRGPAAVPLREQVLARAEKRRMNPKVRRGLLVKEFLKRDYLLSMIEKDTSWNGGTLIVPFKPNGVIFGSQPSGPIDFPWAKYERP